MTCTCNGVCPYPPSRHFSPVRTVHGEIRYAEWNFDILMHPIHISHPHTKRQQKASRAKENDVYNGTDCMNLPLSAPTGSSLNPTSLDVSPAEAPYSLQLALFDRFTVSTFSASSLLGCYRLYALIAWLRSFDLVRNSCLRLNFANDGKFQPHTEPSSICQIYIQPSEPRTTSHYITILKAYTYRLSTFEYVPNCVAEPGPDEVVPRESPSKKLKVARFREESHKFESMSLPYFSFVSVFIDSQAYTRLTFYK
ncbi:hypothetical protein PAAG_08347 [Paracoccidioides lutzii Pb01]|uniref:Uncharacterized protein n=1 Tax=Paracoccidioides lutzii (strain ATCC MYA-826 / Pb01) TaxID=502779 RepID=C1HC56_PARBA|nr:hypothetical protein PAAG_08347 [Paracoccidioides lutzii Pb01]EEH38620.2 hypothetical protein PAAG_08347 [Paracoccidioides lutzii Pb01]